MILEISTGSLINELFIQFGCPCVGLTSISKLNIHASQSQFVEKTSRIFKTTWRGAWSKCASRIFWGFRNFISLYKFNAPDIPTHTLQESRNGGRRDRATTRGILKRRRGIGRYKSEFLLSYGIYSGKCKYMYIRVDHTPTISTSDPLGTTTNISMSLAHTRALWKTIA